MDVLGRYRRKSGQFFDCVIGVSGGKDSTRQALWVRDRLKLRPLLVSLTHTPQQVSRIGVQNISNLIELGFDVVISALAPKVWRDLMRESFFKFSNWARPTELALFSSVPQLAIRYGIPLIFWGENTALQVGDLKVMGRTEYDGNNLKHANTLSSGHQWILDAGFPHGSVLPYIYPGEAEFSASEIQIIFLGWFMGDWSQQNNAMYAASNGLRLRDETVLETGDLLGISNLDEDWQYLNQMMKYYKFGFGKITEDVSEEIRNGNMDRDEGIALIRKYDGLCSESYINSFCEYIGISVNEFWSHVRTCVNRDLFDVQADGQIRPKFTVGVGL